MQHAHITMRATLSTCASSISSKPPPLPPIPSRTQKQYNHVESKINSGMTVNKLKTVTLQHYVSRRQEKFYRVSPRQLQALLAGYSDNLKAESEDIGYEGPDDEKKEGPLIVTHESADEAVYDKPFLILDVRDGDQDHSKRRIVHARPFPLAHLHQEKYSPELRCYRNRVGTLIIFYDDDEKMGQAASLASQLVERGWENVFVLSGGIEAFAQAWPAYVEGGLGMRCGGKGSKAGVGEGKGRREDMEPLGGNRLSAHSLSRLRASEKALWGKSLGQRGPRQGRRAGSSLPSCPSQYGRESIAPSSCMGRGEGTGESRGPPSRLPCDEKASRRLASTKVSHRHAPPGGGSMGTPSLAASLASSASLADSVIQNARRAQGKF